MTIEHFVLLLGSENIILNHREDLDMSWGTSNLKIGMAKKNIDELNKLKQLAKTNLWYPHVTVYLQSRWHHVLLHTGIHNFQPRGLIKCPL